MKKILVLFIVCLLFGIQSNKLHANDWEEFANQWSKKEETSDERLKKAKEKADKNEKEFKKLVDKEFENSFKKVFNGTLKPSEALDILKVLEAASAGDFKYAGENGADFLIAKFVPVLGTYITIMKGTADLIKVGMENWSNQIYYTDAYFNAMSLILKASREYPPYIPSYMITYLRNNKSYGKDVQKIWNKMRDKEAWMFDRWKTNDLDHEEAVRKLMHTYQGQLRTKLGKDAIEREVFNHFLHYTVSNKKAKYLEEFQYEYIEPLLRREIRKQKKVYKRAVNEAIDKILISLKKTNKKQIEEKVVIKEEKEKNKEEKRQEKIIKPKKKKVVFFEESEEDIEKENLFRQNMKNEREIKKQKDNSIADASSINESMKAKKESLQFKENMNSLGTALNTAVIEISTQVETERLASKQRAEANKKAYDTTALIKKQKEQKNQRTAYSKTSNGFGGKYSDPHALGLQKGSTNSEKAEFLDHNKKLQSTNTKYTKSVPTKKEKYNPTPLVVNKKSSSSKKTIQASTKTDTFCGYDVSSNSKWMKVGSYRVVDTRERTHYRAKISHSFYDDGCGLDTTLSHKSGDIFEYTSYDFDGKIGAFRKEVYSKTGVRLYVLEYKNFFEGKLREFKTYRLVSKNSNKVTLLYHKEWNMNGKLIINDTYKNGKRISTK